MKMAKDELYMLRCFDLARIGAGKVSPNPMVGAVLVHEDRIIGEGFHQAYSLAHAEVNAIHRVAPKDRSLIPFSTLYVSLEPCCIYGNTPPCTSLILREKIPRVVISAFDRTPGVAGQGVQKLRDEGVQVTTGILMEQGNRLCAIRNTFVTKPRPYVILKYAQTADGYFARTNGQQFWISNAFSKRLVHKWRNETDAILITGRTAQLDNPRLTNRLFYGKSPQRVILDRRLELSQDHHIFDQSVPTLIFHSPTLTPPKPRPGIEYLPLPNNRDLNPVLEQLHQRKISTLMVEGGAGLLQSFIDQRLWDEARVFQSKRYLYEGIKAPQLQIKPFMTCEIDDDQLSHFYYNR